jgi:hypothetical protein
MRVWIKLWKQGERVEGATFGDNGLVYPIIPGKVYVEWEEVVSPDGTKVNSALRYLGHPDDFPAKDIKALIRSSITGNKPRKGSEIPSHLEILSFDEGIDPYKFLDLP